MTKKIFTISNVGGVWVTHFPHWPSIMYMEHEIENAVRYFELIADDFTFTFRTSIQRWPNNCIDLDGTIDLHKPYGPKWRQE